MTSATGLLFGATWLLDRVLTWQLRREAVNLAGCNHSEPASTPIDVPPAPGCAVMGCGAPVTTSIHGWDLCHDHDPRTPAPVDSSISGVPA